MGTITFLLGVFLMIHAAQPSDLGAKRLAETPWPTYRGDLERTGLTSYTGPSTNKILWIFSTGRSEEKGGIETDPVIGRDGSVYIGGNNGIFYALDPKSGEIRWAFITEFDTYAIYSSPFVDQDGIAYFGAKDGNVYAVRPPRKGITGELAWSLNLGTTIQTSPAFTPDGTLVIGADDWAYYGITPPRGDAPARIKWRFQTQGTLITSPAVDSNGTIYVASMDGNVHALEPPKEPGGQVKVLWRFASGDRDEKGGFENATALDNKGVLYTGGNDGIFYALEAKSGRVRWTFDDVARAGYRTYAIFSSAAIGPDGTIYFGGKNGVLYSLRERTGFFRTGPEVLWDYRLGPGIQSSPLLAADGTVYIGNEHGTFHAVRPPKGGGEAEALWKFETKGTIITNPALDADGTLYVGSMDGSLYAFNDRGRPSGNREKPFSGTWYGSYKSELVSGAFRAVLVQKEEEVWATWFLDGLGRGEFHGKIRNDRATFSQPINTPRCKGTISGQATRQGNQIRADIVIDQCMGKIVRGQAILSNR
jgi:outer membrane protein assembly factor BamB